MLVYFVILVNTLYYHNIVSLVYPISLFAFAIMETPRPNKPFWRFLFLYTTFIICLKFIIFIPGIVVCDTLVGYSNFNTFTFSWPYSFSVKNCPPVHGNGLRLAQLIGIDYNSADNKADRSFVFTVLADLMILLMLNLNQLSLKQAGLWDFVDAREHDLYNFEEEEPVEEEVEPLIEKKQRAITKLTKTLQSVPTNEEPKEDQNVPLEEESLNDMDLKFQSDPEDFVVLKKGKLQAQSSEELLSLYKSEEETPKSAEETTIASLPPKENSVYDIEEYHPSISSQSTPKKTILEQIEIFGKETVANIDKYYKDIFNEKKNGADYYAGIFGVDVLSFMLLAFFPTEFISESSNLVEFLNENSLLPTAFVVILLGQFGMIVIERMIYLFQAIRIKLILLYIYILFYHFAIFVYIPMQQRKQMSELPATVIFYLLKLTYFFLTGLQIRNGYPKLVTGRSFQSDEEPGYVSMICFVLYRIIPFLYELRTLLDWAITPTTLTSYEWLKFEDIYAELFLVKCRICLERMWERKSGDYQPAYYKILTGGGLFLLFVFVLWSPLIIFTQGTNIGGTNPVTQGSISFGITGYKSLYDAEDIQCLLLSEDYFSSILNVINDEIIVLFNYEDRKSAVESKLSESSFSVWTISPPLKTKLIHDLKNNTELFFTVTMAFYRNQPDRTKSIIWKNNPRKISAPESTVLYAILTNTTNQLNDTFKNYTYDANSVILRDFFPRAYRLPITGTIKPSPKTVDVILSLNTMIDEIQVNNTTQYSKSEYWSIQQIRQPPFFNESEVELIVVSQPFVNWIPESIVVAGIISVYSVFVLGLGRFLRIYVSGLSHRAIFEDMPEVDELLEYCTDILLARQDGVPELEEELFRELVEIYRSPERMIRMTLPRATRFKDMSKEKID
uniref:Uncharacterized protein n=1 Tax=Arcella intermedia TaxID=1963864 RepID=A0A6B2KXL2_9EUKA